MSPSKRRPKATARHSAMANITLPVLALSVADAARAVGIGRSTLWALIKDDRLPVVRCGRRTLVRVAALDVWLKNMEANA